MSKKAKKKAPSKTVKKPAKAPRHKATAPVVSKIVDAKSFKTGRRGGPGVYLPLFEQVVKLDISKGDKALTVVVEKGDEARRVQSRLLAALRRFPARVGKGYRLAVVVGVDDCAGQVAVFKRAV